ncbi:WXG100 family type VII secretion target [Paenibacillus pinisoli]|nr:WXG100 family type VII secretion target [Paenibacillus pinisoli]
MSKVKVVVDPLKLTEAAQNIEGMLGDYVRLYTSLYTEVNAMGAAWKGRDNRAYTEKIKEFENDFKQMKAMLSDYQLFLTNSAKDYTLVQDTLESGARRIVT